MSLKDQEPPLALAIEPESKSAAVCMLFTRASLPDEYWVVNEDISVIKPNDFASSNDREDGMSAEGTLICGAWVRVSETKKVAFNSSITSLATGAVPFALEETTIWPLPSLANETWSPSESIFEWSDERRAFFVFESSNTGVSTQWSFPSSRRLVVIRFPKSEEEAFHVWSP